MRCVVGYFRLADLEVEDDPRVIERLATMVRDYAERHAMPMQGIFVDRYGIRRAPLSQLALALALVRREMGILVIPSLGRTQRDPEFLETLYNADVPFEVLDQPAVTRNTILALGMSAFRKDQRRT